jgi:phage terminase large subunit
VTRIVIPYEPRPLQADMHAALEAKRFAVAVCHRRFGKTVLAVNHLIRRAVTCKLERPRFAYLAPTYRMAKQIAWDYVLHYTQPIPGRTVNVSELRVDFEHNGSQIRLYGADNPDSLRGIYLDGVVADEYGMMPGNVWGEILRPALADRQGWALFLGTPAGRNQFYELIHGDLKEWPGAKNHPDWHFAEYKASQTGYVLEHELRAARQDMTPDEYEQEFECSFEAAVKGAIYAKELATAVAQGRITRVPFDPALPVDTDWDLGVGDNTAIWFSQSLRSGEVRLIDYYEASGEGIQHYAQVLGERRAQHGYVYGKHWGPHDVQVRELGTGKTRIETARQYGIAFEVTPRMTQSAAGEVEEGINAARLFLARCWFDAERCKAGIEALKHYRRDYNERLREFKATPVHDWASHGADAFRGLAVRWRLAREAASPRRPRPTGGYAWT